MSWRDEPATSSQLVTIREFYARAIGWNNAQAKIGEMKKNGCTKGEASEELTRLIELKNQGKETSPKN